MVRPSCHNQSCPWFALKCSNYSPFLPYCYRETRENGPSSAISFDIIQRHTFLCTYGTSCGILLVLSSHAFNRKRVYSLTFCRVSDLKTAKIRIMFKHLRLHTYLYYHSLGTRSVSSVQIWLQTSFSWRNTSTKNHLDRKRKKGSSFVPDGARPERLMVHDAARGWKKKFHSKFLKYNFLGFLIVLVV